MIQVRGDMRGAEVRRASSLAVLGVVRAAALGRGGGVEMLHPLDAELARAWLVVLRWALAEGRLVRGELVAGLSLGRMQGLSQAWVMARAAVPESCGPAILAAPARGAAIRFQPVAVVPKGASDWAIEPVGYRGRDAIRQADGFDKLERAARRKGEAGPFSPGQISAGRAYAALVEFVSAGGVKLSSLEARGGGAAPGAGLFIDRYSDAVRQLEALRRRLGDRPAMAVRRVRPSRRGAESAVARSIGNRALVEGFCVAGQSLVEILLAHGWCKTGRNVEALRAALAEALELIR